LISHRRVMRCGRRSPTLPRRHSSRIADFRLRSTDRETPPFRHAGAAAGDMKPRCVLPSDRPPNNRIAVRWYRREGIQAVIVTGSASRDPSQARDGAT
jgi:hypothetical protein